MSEEELPEPEFPNVVGGDGVFTSLVLDPSIASGGALTILNSTSQTSGSLASITGETGQVALSVPVGNVLIGEKLAIGDDSVLGFRGLELHSESSFVKYSMGLITNTNDQLASILVMSKTRGTRASPRRVKTGGELGTIFYSGAYAVDDVTPEPNGGQ